MMTSAKSQLPSRHRLTDHERDAIVACYELGTAHANKLAVRFGVHPNTVYKLLRERGAVKGYRAQETVAELSIGLDAKLRRQAEAKVQAQLHWLDTFNARANALVPFMEALIEADRSGELAAFGEAFGSCSMQT